MVTIVSVGLFYALFHPTSSMAASCPAGVHCVCAGTSCVDVNDCGAGGLLNCSTTSCASDTNCASAVDQTMGRITPPIPIADFKVGIPRLFSNVLRLMFIVAGLWAFLNIIIAGFQFMNAGGDPKAIQSAWGRIWQSLVGLTIIVTSFILAAIIGYVLYGNPGAILQPSILGP